MRFEGCGRMENAALEPDTGSGRGLLLGSHWLYILEFLVGLQTLDDLIGK